MNRKLLSHFKTNAGLTMFFDTGNPVTLASTNSMFKEIWNKISRGRTEDIDSLLDLALKIKRKTKGKFELIERDGQDFVLINGKELPESLSTLLIKFVEMGANTDYLEKFWNKLSQNPEPSARESLYDFIAANHTTLTENGNFLAYKSVLPNFTDIHTGKFDNSVGSVVEMDRKDVVLDRKVSCSSGLHAAAWEYAHGFGTDKVVVQVEIDPKDVVSVPVDYNSQKMRVCKYKVNCVVTEPTKEFTTPQVLTDKEQKVLDFVIEVLEDYGSEANKESWTDDFHQHDIEHLEEMINDEFGVYLNAYTDESLIDFAKRVVKEIPENETISCAYPVITPICIGEANGQAKLNEDKVKGIRRCAAAGWTTKQIAEQYSVSCSTVRRVVNKKSWNHVN